MEPRRTPRDERRINQLRYFLELRDALTSFDTFSNIDDARQWRNRAEEMRMVAEEMISVSNKAIAQRLADSYERLAKHAEERVESNKRIGT
jgi:hypothetical protein